MGGRRSGQRRRGHGDDEEETVESRRRSGERSIRHGDLSIALALLVTSSAFFIYNPPELLPSKFKPSFDPFFLSNQFGFGSKDKMYARIENDNYQMNVGAKPHFGMRPMGLRWRDDARAAYEFSQNSPQLAMMPVLTEQRTQSQFGRSISPTRPTTSSYESRSSHEDTPSLEDLDLIDVLWRSDLAAEKGARQIALAEQYESDLQMLTEKSTHATLTAEERARYEDLSKVFFEDFYSPQSYRDAEKSMSLCGSAIDMMRETNTPTDEELAELFEDVSKEGGQLDQLDSMLEPQQQPLVQNVSLAQGIVYTQNNLTELDSMRESAFAQQCSSGSAQMAIPANATLFNNTDPNIQPWLGHSEMTPGDVFPYMTLQNDTVEQVVSNGNVDYDHCYQSRQRQSISPAYDPYYSNRISFSNTTDSSMSSQSSDYHSETDSRSSPSSRFFGKLVPDDRKSLESDEFSDAVVPHDELKAVPLNGQRKRGRQSKDEQLASDNKLPLSAKQIAEMNLSELQKVLKNDRLTEYQRQLIRKIRRRGKNKVAARTCRQRRNDRGDKKDGFEM
ncbi:unnamed protein product [Caenorhabditis auriculariae]|uniref:BZIP domain-containing protein n=1 Tax=Caenorhabditis auriculariae TaxID=2777116 RepID=A0A8S1HI75_9PELO|nr:unnamed protein product [Caenorhabditis auriculariae]